MNYSVADVIASVGGDIETDISAILPYGIAPGAKAVMRKEKKAAEEAISTGIYVTWRSMKTGLDCARIGSMSRCFCGCSYEMHAFRKGHTLPVCKACECQGFDFVPSRPEEIGEWWLPRRPGFDVSSWKAKCRCGHSHEAHHPVRRSCGSCKCGEFNSAYGCVVCESHQEDHQTQVESAQERVDAGRPVGRDFIPLSQSPQLSQLTFGRKNRRSSGEGASSKSKAITVAAKAEGDGGNSSLKSETRLTLPTPSLGMAKETRANSRLSSETDYLAAAVSSGRASQVSRIRTIATPSQGNRGALGRVVRGTNSTGSAQGGGNSTSPTPELLYGSGRITAARYHEMLAEMDGRGARGNGEGGHGAVRVGPAARMAAVASRRNTGGARGRRDSVPPQQDRSNTEMTFQNRPVIRGKGASKR